MRLRYPVLLTGVIVCRFTPWGCAQDTSVDSRLKICVAEINNRTATSLMTDRLTERLARNLTSKERKAVAMQSRTTDRRDLRPTVENSEEAKQLECNYLVLTQVTDPRSNPTDLAGPQIAIGGRRPSPDSGDPVGASVRDSLEIDFALYRTGSPEPLLQTRLLDEPSSTIALSLTQGMDREANRIGHELKNMGH